MEIATIQALTGAGLFAASTSVAIYGWQKAVTEGAKALANEKKRTQYVMLLDRWNKAKYYRAFLMEVRNKAKASKQKTSHFDGEIQKLTDKMIALELLMQDRSDEDHG